MTETDNGRATIWLATDSSLMSHIRVGIRKRKKHVIDVTRSCHYHIHALCHVRPLLMLDTDKAMAVAIVGSRLDYCNSVEYCTECRKRT